ncbi:MAG: helix-turn-helix domain-containing protein [Bacteroidota bacterium]
MIDWRQEQFDTIQPQKLLLQPHIAYYYFHQTFKEDFQRVFTYYPNYHVALNIFRHSNIQWKKDKRCTLPDPSKRHTAILTFSTQGSRDVCMNGCIQKIGVIFRPLGFNHFIDVPLGNLIQDTITSFDYYDSSFNEVVDRVFEAATLPEKRDLLDNFFLEHYHPIALEELQIAVSKIMKENGQCIVDDLAKSLNLNRKTLLRHFNKHLGLHIRGFSNLVRFRNALQLYKKQKGNINLTQLAHEAQYYDQADFIKNIRAFTGLTPKKLFYQQREIGGQNTFWTSKNRKEF